MDSMGRGERIDRPCAAGVPGFLFGELGGRRRCCSWRWGNIFIQIFFFKVEYLGQRKKSICWVSLEKFIIFLSGQHSIIAFILLLFLKKEIFHFIWKINSDFCPNDYENIVVSQCTEITNVCLQIIKP